MTPNDTQIDILMRRYAKQSAQSRVGSEHPDADELNAFAEGALPPAARAGYVSHLADCDECRQMATQLAIAAGVTKNETPASAPLGEKSWWQRLGIFLSPPALRYAAFAVVLVAVVGISFVVWRQPGQKGSDLIARNEPNANQVSAVKPAETSGNENTLARSKEPNTGTQQTPSVNLGQEQAESKPFSPPPPAKSVEETVDVTEKPSIAYAKAPDAPRAQSSPSYAPPPPAEIYRTENRSRDAQPSVGASPGGPRRNESYEKYKVEDRARAIDQIKEGEADRNQPKAAQSTTSVTKDDSKREFGILSESKSARKAKSKDSGEDERAGRASTAKAEEVRSVGGRKFQRQGNSWVDVKLKPSMSVKSIARGSDDFNALDSGLRSIAQQLSGEVVVVWKGKAYRIR
jgi:hypothetical protein